MTVWCLGGEIAKWPCGKLGALENTWTWTALTMMKSRRSQH